MNVFQRVHRPSSVRVAAEVAYVVGAVDVEVACRLQSYSPCLPQNPLFPVSRTPAYAIRLSTFALTA